MLFFVFTALFAAFIPEDIVGEMTQYWYAVRFQSWCVRAYGSCAFRRPDLKREFRSWRCR